MALLSLDLSDLNLNFGLPSFDYTETNEVIITPSSLIWYPMYSVIKGCQVGVSATLEQPLQWPALYPFPQALYTCFSMSRVYLLQSFYDTLQLLPERLCG